MTVRTAADLAAVDLSTPEYHRPRVLGGPGGTVVVNAAELGATLRRFLDSGADMVHRGGWWELRSRTAGVTASGETFDELAAAAIRALRSEVDAVDPLGTHAHPLTWLVRLSSDDELRGWLRIPTS